MSATARDNEAGRRVEFASGGAFIRAARSEVEAYLADHRVNLGGRLRLFAKAPIAIGLIILSWAVLLFGRPGVPIAVVCLLGLLTGTVIVAFCVQHDANHGSYFKSRRLNHLLGWSTDTLLGISSYAWRVKHNVAHHTFTNVDGYDADATQVPLAKFMPSQPARPWYRFQHLYIWPMYTLMGLRWQTFGDINAFMSGEVGQSKVRIPKGWNLVGLFVGKLIFVSWAIVLPLLFYPWWVVLIAYVSITMLMSLVMATTFQLAHCVEEADFATSDELIADKRVWAVHEVETTVNFCPRNPVLTWFLGGLNYQIEHHLFPKVPHTHYPQIAKIVSRLCDEHGIRYSQQPNLWFALRSHFRHLRTMGKQGLPAEFEMG